MIIDSTNPTTKPILPIYEAISSLSCGRFHKAS